MLHINDHSTPHFYSWHEIKYIFVTLELFKVKEFFCFFEFIYFKFYNIIKNL